MKILWLDINSSYSHSSVALPAIHAQVSDKKDWEWEVVRGTINDNPGNLAVLVAKHKPDVIAATFWLFTHKMQIEVLSRAIQMLDDVKVVCGGPEFLGNNESFLRQNPFVTAVIRGEGEEALPALLSSINDPTKWGSIDGICWLSENDRRYHDNGIARVADFAGLKYPEESSFFNWDKPFIQLETTRGCFNTCSFCVSSGEKPVRYQTLEQVESRLENICSNGIKDVRVLDRTFNYNPTRAIKMLEIFARYAGKMRFHLEIHPALLTESIKEKIKSLPDGLLHLEAGIQSLDRHVLTESGRKGSLESSLEGLEFLCRLDNVQTHADLIVGLPGYTLEMLCDDIIRLIRIGADELQMESLKVLPGTRFRENAKEKGLVHSPLPPYEILMTKDISPDEIRKGMQISRMTDLYYNCSAWQEVTRKLICTKKNFLIDFTNHLAETLVLDSPISTERRGVILYEYCKKHDPDMATEVSIAWIKAGFSLKKEPAGDITKIKHIQEYLEANGLKDTGIEQEIIDNCRYYLFTSSQMKIIIGYDSETHLPYPTIVVEIK